MKGRGEKGKPQLYNLPDGVLELIIQYLPLVDKLSFRVTCERIATEVARQVKLHPELSDENADAISNIKQEKWYNFTSLKTTNLKKSRFFPARGPEFGPRITKLGIQENPQTGETISSANFYRMFHMFPNVVELSITGKVLSGSIGLNPRVFFQIKLDHLLVLKMSFTGTADNFECLQALAFARFPRMKQLDVHVGAEHLKLGFEDYCFLSFLIGTHASTLKHLKIDDHGIEEILDQAIPHVDEKVTSVLRTVQLESFELSNMFTVAQNTWPPLKWTYAGAFIAAQQSLKVLSVNFTSAYVYLRPQILTAIRQSSNTMESLTYKHDRQDRFYSVDMESFPCQNLRTLNVRTPIPVVNLHMIPRSIEYLVWDSPINLREVDAFRQYLRNLIEIVLGPLAGTPSNEVINGIFENPKTESIICLLDARLQEHLAQIQAYPMSDLIIGFPVDLRREFFQQV